MQFAPARRRIDAGDAIAPTGSAPVRAAVVVEEPGVGVVNKRRIDGTGRSTVQRGAKISLRDPNTTGALPGDPQAGGARGDFAPARSGAQGHLSLESHGGSGIGSESGRAFGLLPVELPQDFADVSPVFFGEARDSVARGGWRGRAFEKFNHGENGGGVKAGFEKNSEGPSRFVQGGDDARPEKPRRPTGEPRRQGLETVDEERSPVRAVESAGERDAAGQGIVEVDPEPVNRAGTSGQIFEKDRLSRAFRPHDGEAAGPALPDRPPPFVQPPGVDPVPELSDPFRTKWIFPGFCRFRH